MKFSIFYLSFEGSTIKIGLIVLELRNFKMWHFFGQKSEKCGKKMPSPAPIYNFFNFFFYFHKLHMKTKLCAKFQHLKMIFTEINQGGSFYPPVNQRTLVNGKFLPGIVHIFGFWLSKWNFLSFIFHLRGQPSKLD